MDIFMMVVMVVLSILVFSVCIFTVMKERFFIQAVTNLIGSILLISIGTHLLFWKETFSESMNLITSPLSILILIAGGFSGLMCKASFEELSKNQG